jgi:hypothetical protein
MANSQTYNRPTGRPWEIVIAPLCEAALIAAAGMAAWVTKQPLVFTSLGPTAFEMIETPHRKSAKPYNVVGGHLIGVASGFAALWITGAWWLPPVSAGHVALARVGAAAVASLLTVLGTMLAKATQPAALSTTLLIALGTLQVPRDAAVIMAAVLLITGLGEPLRIWRNRENSADG